MKRLLTSKEVKELFGIKSDTTLIKMENEGYLKYKLRIGNKKMYCPVYIAKKLGQ
ncbi:hypothetical protein [Croceibacter atlanticus]|jgi:hypothetical protein|uniref:Helix-turn-helix domain-containing protein n=1 Tax=Croceibacter atlanticus (strain ATCC BAA-628 / JCM 21780 / CIP 108009 / IAM 15332 / KCTC 12090 / HTCC2559) TaxID=216432 RepID=A3U6R8_CROAH|nr:hypothetical protein [Croceibacter atlanticus]EAP87935.1 hypothetical protein CA2559_04230 [Croceibacter atlanticus HTCC2559]